ncbi:MAG TPA: leucine-rich repeat domain-containing protein [Crocinitomix sp.]|nr:leucine-rich repeat domain-containing protein [Crocinitomix sp.]
MKVNVVLFWVIILILPLKSVSQTQKLFTSIEEAFLVPVDSVYRLDLSKQKMTKLPKEVSKFINLKELYLSKNKLHALPNHLLNLQKLEVLDLSKNNFKNFPPQLCSLQSLKQLFLGRNNIQVIPDCIGQIKNLEILDLWLNPIGNLPQTISNLKKLKVIDLRGINFSATSQEVIKALIPWAKVEFNKGCDCAH